MELETLSSNGRQLKVNISVALDRLKDEEVDVIQENIASLLASIEKGLSLFVQSLSSIDARLLLIYGW